MTKRSPSSDTISRFRSMGLGWGSGPNSRNPSSAIAGYTSLESLLAHPFRENAPALPPVTCHPPYSETQTPCGTSVVFPVRHQGTFQQVYAVYQSHLSELQDDNVYP